MLTPQACWTGDVAATLDQWRAEPPRTPVTADQVEKRTLAALGDLVEAAARLTPADGAVIVLYQGERPGLVVGSDAGSLDFALAEADLEEGPGLAAVSQEQVVQSDDLSGDPRWPRLAAAAGARDVRAVLSVPFKSHEDSVGICILISRSPGGWDDHVVSTVQAATGGLGHLLQAGAEARAAAVVASQLQHALHHRTVIEQAKGALIERMGITGEAAFELIRTTARSSRHKVVDVAAAVLAGQTLPTPSSPSAPG